MSPASPSPASPAPARAPRALVAEDDPAMTTRQLDAFDDALRRYAVHPEPAAPAADRHLS